MARGMIVGSTDYGNQSLEDIRKDLIQWINSLEETIQDFNAAIEDLESNGMWTSLDYDFKSSSLSLIRFFNTAITDIKNVIDGIDSEIKEYHINLVMNLGQKAHELYELHRKIWRQVPNKQYGNPNFRHVEKLYEEGSNMTGDMFDLNNVAPRLKQFVGKSNSGDGSTNPVTVTNNFNSPVSGMQQNYNSHDVHQNNNQGSESIHELKQMIGELQHLIEKESTSEHKKEVLNNLEDLDETLSKDEPRTNQIKAFGNAITGSLKNMLTMKSFKNTEEVSSKLPKIIENFQSVLDKF
ncbi:hypothetical protein ACQ4XT_00295 [Halobacillus faecis]